MFLVSFSGAMQPGPVTATAITMGGRNRYAGLLLAVGHGVIEFPLMVLIMLGAGKIFESDVAQLAVGFAGGIALLLMGVQMLARSKCEEKTQAVLRKDSPIWAGVVLTASNPYFLIWWGTIGLALATEAKQFGVWAFGIFAIVHWLVDLIWVGTLSFASFYGGRLMGPKVQQVVVKICAVAMLWFAAMFIYRAAIKLTGLLVSAA